MRWLSIINVIIRMTVSLAPHVVVAAPIVVASKMDTEGALLGSIIADILEEHGLVVERRIRLGSTDTVRAELLAGRIDIYPEYTGNGALFFLDHLNDRAWKDAEGGYALIASLDKSVNHLIWLARSPANNDWVIAIRNDLPDFPTHRCMGDFARYVNGGGRVKLEASAEFIKSPAALQAYEDTYDFFLLSKQLLPSATGDTALTLRDAAEETFGVNAAMTYGTDGQITALGLSTLCDDKHAQVVYAPAPVIREDVLKKHPEIAAELQSAFAPLTTETLQRLNAAIAINGEDAATVAAAYLKSMKLVR